MIDTTNWQWFRIGDLFNVSGTTTTSLEDLQEIYGSGIYPYITTQATNNGVAGYYNYYTEAENVIVIDSACLGYASYQKYKFSASDHVEKLSPKNFILNECIGMFLVSIMNLNNFRYSYGRKYNQSNIKNTIIKLPAIKNTDGVYEPDWQYMENYIKSLNIQLPKTQNQKNLISVLKPSTWQEFKIGNLFDVFLSGGDIKEADSLEGIIPLISSGSVNNGVVKYIDENGDGIAKIFSANNITVDMFGQAYYQPHKFYSVSHGRINILSPKQINTLNQYNALFVCSIINKEQFRFSYNRAVYSNVISNTIIKLPAIKNADGVYEPDWQYMENYIKSLPYGDLI